MDFPESSILSFRKYRESHWSDYFRLVSDARVMQFITGKPLDEHVARTKFNMALEMNTQHPFLSVYFTSLKATGEHIGTSKLVLTGPDEAELGYALYPDYWGRGFATEITRALIEHAQRVEEVHHLKAITDPANAASIHILKKAGFLIAEETEIDGLPGLILRMDLV